MLTGKKVKVYEADTRDYSSIINIFQEEAATGKSIEAVVHLAGLKAVGESVQKPHSKSGTKPTHMDLTARPCLALPRTRERNRQNHMQITDS